MYKFRSIYFLYGILTAAILFTQTWKTAANGILSSHFRSPLTLITDTIKPIPGKDSINRLPAVANDTTRLPGRDSSFKETTDTFSLKISKDSLDAPLKYAAEDSAVILIVEKKIILYGKTKTDYKDISLTAPKVIVDQQTQVVTAVNKKDSTGKVIETAHFKSKDSDFTSDTIQYNFKTQVGLTKNTYTMQGEFLVIAEKAKKVSENVTFASKATFTTCILDEPHFGIKTNKMKVINQKLAVSGPAHLEFEGVPIPLYLPFGFYPLSQGRHSGLLPPRFANNEQFGLGLEGLGYYKVISEYWDARVYGNIYSYGGWSVNVNPTYRKRYRYSGAFNISVQNTRQNFKGDPDFFNNKSYFLTWSHSVDGKARPGTSFSANVNAGSTKFNQLVPNSNQVNFQNQLGSSITYSKTWAGKPYNLSLSANHNQNSTTRLINVSLPDAGFSVSTLYPFQGKNSAGSPKWYEKLGVGYNGNFRNQVSFYDTAFKLKSLIDTLQWGAQHSFPITLSLPPIMGGAVIVAPSVSYSQVWIAQKFRRKWNTATQKADTTITKGFFTDHQATFSISFNTAIFGTYQFKKSRVVAIRHVIRPSLSFNYKPDLSKQHFYTDTISPGFAYRMSEYEGALYSGFGEGRTGGIGFQLDNNLEMKWRSKKDTGMEAIKKVKLIDGYGLSTGYNFLRDSLKLDLFNLYLRATLFEKISITANAILDPYQTDANGVDIDKFAWQGGKFKLGRLSYGSISMSTSLRSKPKDAKKEAERKKRTEQQLNDPNLIGDQQRLLDYMQQNPSEFVDFNVPWQLNIGYSLYFSTRLKPDLSGFRKEVTSSINFSGSFNLTPKWNFSVSNVNYDFTTKQIQTFSMSINREMHCWQLSINVTPVGLYRSFNFSISPKASVLQDLKINRTRSFTNF
ncbi:MAG: LPS-assembly protein LptD [Chitinophagaceae bacterium]|nr:LPS-assembly protein LptD [Chitinophagaceae bacterium]MBK7679479.1 LPS-assembly protein LptD [Chitinophagaceae bacterium]MBK8299172.1 LPS-assembly protein LptD [Chitinophagaceae bacterium]MBK9463223.1 LPS-assembly protein LptD [Chitinophagaceae bacterium]MBK9659647.1 LPS-assembly protein LptD [Chitinophagaceae bacterium]